jgi:hypothetical protein
LRVMDFFILHLDSFQHNFHLRRTPLTTISCKCHQMSCSLVDILDVCEPWIIARQLIKL